MLKVIPFANALALTTTLFYFVMWLLNSLAPSLFVLLYNSQFMGAPAAQSFPPSQDPFSAVTSLIVVALSSWVMGYLLAYLYNRLVKDK